MILIRQSLHVTVYKKVQKKDITQRKMVERVVIPIIAFVNEVKMVANFWLRSCDSSSANNFVGFLEDTMANFGTKK